MEIMDAPLEQDQPLTPMGRTLIQPILDNIINCVMSLENPIDPQSIRTQLSTSVMLKQPRFCSLMVRDSYGREHWRKTHVEVDRHIIIHHNRLSEDPDEDAVNEYVANLSHSMPLHDDKPLWEIHLLLAHNVVVLRMHHALGDATSLMSILLSWSDRKLKKQEKNLQLVDQRKKWSLLALLKMIWYTFVYVIEYALTEFWRKDKRTVLSGGAGVEIWPRRLATAKFSLEDMKIVKRAVPNATINDVVSGVVSSGLSRYLEIASPKALPKGQRLTGLATVNLRPRAGIQVKCVFAESTGLDSIFGVIPDLPELMDSKLYGNKFGMIQFPIYYDNRECDHDPIRFVKIAKSLMDKKKLSFEALFSYKFGQLTAFLFGMKLTNIINYRILCHTTFFLSNMMGPLEKITFGGNPVKYIRATSSSTPQAIGMYMVSYAGMADMQIQVAKDIIPHPKILAKCFEDALLEMKKAAMKICLE